MSMSILRALQGASHDGGGATGGLASDLEFHHPFLSGPLRGVEPFRRFWAELERVVEPLVFTHDFRADSLAATVWSASFGGKRFQGVTVGTLQGDRIVELRVLLRPLPLVKPLRDALRARFPELADAQWALPPGTDVTIHPFDPDQPVDARLPIPTTEDIVFHSPIFEQAIRGEALVKRVIGHAAAVYGGRIYGPRVLSGRRALTQWAGVVAGLPIQAVNVSSLDEQGRIEDLALFMGPLPTLEVFFDQIRPRIEPFLGPQYFGAWRKSGET
jgi:hypothetical protein